jgi:hypothetical protein
VEHQWCCSFTSATHTYFSITVSDGTQTSSLTQSILIYPYFYGFSEQLIINVNAMVGLTKKVEYKGDKIIDISGSGNFTIYDNSYGLMSNPPVINGVSAVYSRFCHRLLDFGQ